MADRSSERDRRVRQLMGNKNPGFDVLGQAQAEIQDAQSELYNHIALQNTQEQARLRETATISQAAQGMLAMEGGDQLRVQAATMNPSTQATLGRFGVKPQQSQNSSRNSSNQRIVTRTGDTTNIRNENITNNRTEIKVTQPQIPMRQSSPIVLNGGGGKNDSTAKFKTWLSEMFARQQNEAEIQKKEYRKKEWNLGRTTNRLMKKIGEATSNIGNKLDPKNMTSSLGGQIKWLLLIFGATMIGKVWKPAMEFLANLEGGFRAVFGIPMNEELRRNSTKSLSIIDKFREAIGIDPKTQDTSLIKGIGKVFMQGIDKLIDKLKFWFEDRATAMREVQFPSMGKIDFGALGNILGPAMEGVVSSLKGVGQYLGDLITVALGGSKGAVKVEANRVQRQANQLATNTKGKKTSLGDSALGTGKGRDYMRESDFNAFGDLKGNASSTQAMSRNLISLFNDNSGKGHTAEIASGISQIFKVADRQGNVVIDPELLGYLGINQRDLMTLQKNGMLTQRPFRIISVRPNDYQMSEMGGYDGHWGAGIGATSGALAMAYGGAALGSFLGPGGTILGAGAGLLTGALFGGAGGTGIDKWIKSITSKGLYPKLVPADSSEMSVDGSPGVGKVLWSLDSRGAKAVKGKLTAGMKNKDVDLTNQEFYKLIRRQSEAIARRNGIALKGETISTESLNVKQANYQHYQDKWDWKFESKDPNSENMLNYGNYNTAIDSGANAINSVRGFISDALNVAGNYMVRKKITKKEALQNAAYTIDRLVRKHGFSKNAAAGIAGNIMQECSFNPNLKIRDINGKYSGGIVMWNGPLLDKIESYYGKDIRQITLDEQIDYLANEMKGTLAINRNGIVSKYGLKKATMFELLHKAQSAGEAGNIMERGFEGSIDYKRDGNKNRMGYSNETLDYYNSVSGGGENNFSSTQSTLISSNGGSSSPIIDSSSSGNIFWLGDSQSVAGKGLFPTLVGQGLGGSFTFFGRESANANHYLGSASESNLGRVATNTTKSSCREMFEYTLNSSPKYTIIALGHNGTSGYPTMVSKLRGAGSKIIGIKMWAIDGSKSGMHKYSSEQMEKMYSGINLDQWVDLTKLNVPKVSDGVHASTEGCKIAAEETLRQLRGEGKITQSDGSISGKILEAAGDLLLKGSDLIDPNKNSSDENLLLNNYTPKQKEIINKLRDFKIKNELFNANSYIARGARIDELGNVYFETTTSGGETIRGEVDTTRTSAISGFNPNSFTEMYKVDPITGKRNYNVSMHEIEELKKSTSIDIFSYFSKYEGKNTTSDLMTDRNGKRIELYLGEFFDTKDFSNAAKVSLMKKYNGKIQYWITPTKTRTEFAIIRINEFDISVGDFNNKGKITGGRITVGPKIFVRGSKHETFSSFLGEKKEYIDWQPEAYFFKVGLTPEARQQWEKLKRILSYGKLEKGGMADQFIKEDGTSLTTDEVNLARKAGITGELGSENFGKLMEGYNQAQEEAKKIIDDATKFNAKEYLSNFGKTKKEIINNILKGKDSEFFFINGKIYSKSGGVEIGTYDEKNTSKIKLHDESYISNLVKKIGQEGLDENQSLISKHLSREWASSFGILSANDIFDSTRNYKRSDNITHEESKRIQKRRKTFKGYVTTESLSGKPIQYNVFPNADGTPGFFTITPDQLALYTGSDAGIYVKNLTGKHFYSEKDLFEGVLKFEAISRKKGETNTTTKEEDLLIQNILKTQVGYGNKGSKRLSEIKKFSEYLIGKGKSIYLIHFGNNSQTIWYKNISSPESTKFFIPTDSVPKDITSFISQINAIIKRRNEELEEQRFIDSWDNSPLRDAYQQLADKANKGEISVTDNGDGTVTTQGGAILKKGKDGKYIIPEAEEAFKSIKDYWGTDENKVNFYRKRFGAVQESDGLYIYAKNGKTRARVDLDKSISEDLNDILVDSQFLDPVTGKWKTADDSVVLDKKGGIQDNQAYKYNYSGKIISPNTSQKIINYLAAEGDEDSVNKTFDLLTEQVDKMLEELGIQSNQGIQEAKRAILREKREKDDSSQLNAQTKLLTVISEQLGDDGGKTSEILDELRANQNKSSIEELKRLKDLGVLDDKQYDTAVAKLEKSDSSLRYKEFSTNGKTKFILDKTKKFGYIDEDGDGVPEKSVKFKVREEKDGTTYIEYNNQRYLVNNISYRRNKEGKVKTAGA